MTRNSSRSANGEATFVPLRSRDTHSMNNQVDHRLAGASTETVLLSGARSRFVSAGKVEGVATTAWGFGTTDGYGYSWNEQLDPGCAISVLTVQRLDAPGATAQASPPASSLPVRLVKVTRKVNVPTYVLVLTSGP